jgi:hypothetical protein
MTKSSSPGGKTPPDRRKARLAQALRDNLKKRKSQARERREADSGDAEGTGVKEPGPGRRS